jgi:acyl carrier protein
MSNLLASEICQLVADVMGVPSSSIDLTSSPDTVTDWDSVKQLSLAVALEERYGIALEPEEVESLDNVAAVLALVQARRK